MVVTGTTSSTINLHVQTWRDVLVSLDVTRVPLDECCPPGCHDIEVLHHLGENGEHYCPTEMIWCYRCGAVGDEPEPFECHRVGY